MKFIYSMAALAVLASSSISAQAAGWKTFTQDGYSFKYPPAWGKVRFSTVKAQALDNPTDIPDGVAPAHVECRFSQSKAELYFYPIKDAQTPDFKKKYAVVSQATNDLEKLLQKKTAAPKALPLLPWGDTGTLLNARIKYVVNGNVHFVRCLSQYNSEPTPINNSDLRYSGQGLTKDDKYYVSAYLPARAQGLPASDKTASWSKPRYNQFTKTFNRYCDSVRQKLAKMSESGFTPSLAEYDAMVASIQTPQK
ncbi:MAG TPA: hypothetical protein V6C69_13925 [Trichormus sp.]